MLNDARTNKSTVVWLISLWIFFDWSFAWLRTFPSAEPQQAAKYAAEYYGLFNTFSYQAFFWIMDVIERRHDLVIAAATVAIAWFTWTLRRSTDQLGEAGENQLAITKQAADAAKTSADAAIKQADVAVKALTNIERPYIFISNISTLKKDFQSSFDIESGEEYQWFELSVTYSVANHGKIPAIIKSVRVGLCVLENPEDPLQIDYNHPLSIEPIFGFGDMLPKIPQTLDWSKMDTDDHGNIVPDFGADNVFFRIIIEYDGPFTFGHEISDCWIYDSRTERFRSHPDQKYKTYK